MYEVLVADSARCILHDKPLLQPLFALLAYHQTSPVNFEADELVSQLLQVRPKFAQTDILFWFTFRVYVSGLAVIQHFYQYSFVFPKKIKALLDFFSSVSCWAMFIVMVKSEIEHVTPYYLSSVTQHDVMKYPNT